MLILVYVILFSFCFYLSKIAQQLTYAGLKKNKCNEIDKLGNEIIFFSLDFDGENPYYSSISNINCKKKTLYLKEYENSDSNDENSDSNDENSDSNDENSDSDENLELNNDSNSEKYNSKESNDLLNKEDYDQISDTDSDFENEIEENYIINEENTVHSGISELVNYLNLSNKEVFYLVGYDKDIVHLKTHLNNFFEGNNCFDIRFIDVVDFSQKMIKSLNKNNTNEKSSWFTISNKPEISNLESLKNIYGCQENKLSNVLNIFENLIKKLSEDDYLNKMDLMYNISGLYEYIYFDKNLSTF